MSAVTLLFEHRGLDPSERAERVAEAIGVLLTDVERRSLLRFEKARVAHLSGERRLPKRVLVLMGKRGWYWACLCAHFGVNVRWCCPDEKALADGLCWITRDSERFFPDRAAQIMTSIDVSSRRCGFAGRDLVVLDDPSLMTPEQHALCARGTEVFVDAGGTSNSAVAADSPYVHVSFP